MGVFDSFAAAGAGVLSVFFAFGNVLRDTHTLLETTSHICSQSCYASRGIDGERAALVAHALTTLTLAFRSCRRRGTAGVAPPTVASAPVAIPIAAQPSTRRRQSSGKSFALAHLAVDAKAFEKWPL